MRVIEEKHRTDLIYWLRRAINEKFYAIRNA